MVNIPFQLDSPIYHQRLIFEREEPKFPLGHIPPFSDSQVESQRLIYWEAHQLPAPHFHRRLLMSWEGP